MQQEFSRNSHALSESVLLHKLEKWLKGGTLSGEWKKNVFTSKHSCVTQVKTHLLLLRRPAFTRRSHTHFPISACSIQHQSQRFFFYMWHVRRSGLSSWNNNNTHDATMSLHDHITESVNEDASLCVYNVDWKKKNCCIFAPLEVQDKFNALLNLVNPLHVW